MMLRSSSTPLLSSLLSSSSGAAFAESPNHYHPPLPPADPAGDHSTHLSFPSPTHHPRLHVGFRRVQSEGNLEGLGADRVNLPTTSRRSGTVLETIPSASTGAGDPGDYEEEDEEDEGFFDRTVAICDDAGREAPLFLARGLGIDGVRRRLGFSRLSGDGGGSGGYGYPGGDGGGGGGYPIVTDYGGERSDLEGFLKKMVEEHPCDALFLRNYAQFLYKTKRDIRKADEYYSRAILVEPGDGEILAEYAKLVWEHHGDRERAGQYFEQAVQASPQDSHVLAGYAHFLWAEVNESGEGEGCDDLPGSYPHEAMASASA